MPLDLRPHVYDDELIDRLLHAYAIVKAARALIWRLHEVHEDPRYSGVWALAQLHGVPYAGPTYEAEFNALTALLTGKVDDGE